MNPPVQLPLLKLYIWKSTKQRTQYLPTPRLCSTGRSICISRNSISNVSPRNCILQSLSFPRSFTYPSLATLVHNDHHGLCISVRKPPTNFVATDETVPLRNAPLLYKKLPTTFLPVPSNPTAEYNVKYSEVISTFLVEPFFSIQKIELAVFGYYRKFISILFSNVSSKVIYREHFRELLNGQ